jgi:hypothetical protein
VTIGATERDTIGAMQLTGGHRLHIPARAPNDGLRDGVASADVGLRRWVAFLIIGYLLMTRSFAYLGVPPASLFIGELALGLLLFTRTRALNWFLLNRTETLPLRAVRWAMLAYLSHGGVAFAWALWQGYPTIDIVRMFGFHYYVLYLVFGVWAGIQFPGFLPQLVRTLAWATAIYGVLWVVVLNRVPLWIPGSPAVVVFGQPGSGGIVMLGLLAFGLARSHWPLLLCATFVFLGVQMRAEWLGGIAGLAILFMLGRNQQQMIGILVAAILLVAVAFALDLKMDGATGRDGELSVRGIVARSIAPINPQMASDLTGTDFTSFKGTVDWRTSWWEQIWLKINDHPSDAVFFLGMGYGYPIGELGAYGTGGIRTPHNIFFYALGYHGWIGVLAFVTLQGVILFTMMRVYRRTGQPFGILFCNFFETPYGATPYYLMVGLCMAPLVRGPLPSGTKPGYA